MRSKDDTDDDDKGGCVGPAAAESATCPSSSASSVSSVCDAAAPSPPLPAEHPPPSGGVACGLPRAIFSAVCAEDASNRQVVRDWLQAGGDINAQLVEAPVGWTLLMAAAVYERRLLVVELLQRGASTEVRQGQGSTALALASMKGCKAAVDLLLQAGADVHVKDTMGLTPFMCAAAKGHKQICQMLLDKGARTVARLGDGRVTRAAPLSRNAAGEQVWGVQMARRVTPTGSPCSPSDASSAGTTPRPAEEEAADELARRLISIEEAEHSKQQAARLRVQTTACSGSSTSRRGKRKSARAHTR